MKRLGLILSLLLWFSASYAQRFKMAGRLRDYDAQALPAVHMRIDSTGSSVRTDLEGRFEFPTLLAGTYQLILEKEGYSPLWLTVHLQRDTVLDLRMDFHIALQTVSIQGHHHEGERSENSLSSWLIRRDFIDKHLEGSLMQTLARLPGVQAIGIGTGQSKPMIRGLGFNRVSVVDKGIKHESQQWGADHGLEVDQFSVEEIELIKGPAAFRYGSDAMGGVIHLRKNEPPAPHTYGAVLDLHGKTNNQYTGGTLQLYSRRARWYVDSRVSYQRYADFKVPADTVYIYDYAASLPKGRLRNTAGMESAFHLNTGYLSDQWSTHLYLSYLTNETGFFANAHGLEPRRVNTALHDRSIRDLQLPRQDVSHLKLIQQTEIHQNNHRLEVLLGYQRNQRQEYNIYTNHGYMPATYPLHLDIPIHLERQFDKDVYSFSLTDQVRWGSHELETGIQGEWQSNERDGWSFLIPAFNQRSIGIYSHHQVKLSERWKFNTGLRLENIHLQTKGYQDWFKSPTGETGISDYLSRAVPLRRNFSTFVWNTGFIFQQHSHLLKLNMGKSFRAPIAKELAANGVNYHYFSYEKGNPDLRPEQAYQLDLSWLYRPGNWQLQVNPFYQYFPNYIYLNPSHSHDFSYGAGNQIFQYTQSEVIRYGGELEVTYRWLPTLSTSLLGEYVYSIQQSGEKKGYTLPFSPPASVLFNIDWKQKNGVQHPLEAGIDVKYTASQERIVPPEKTSPAYFTIGLYASKGIQLGNQPLRIQLRVQNLLNEHYYNHTSFYRLISLPEQGRNLILTLRIPFKKNYPDK